MADRYDEALASAAAMIELAADKEEARKYAGTIFPELAGPKFRVGDWITNRKTDGIRYEVLQISGINNNRYFFHSRLFPRPIKECDEKFHLWTIKDARAGDIIFSNDGHGTDTIELIKSISDEKMEFWFVVSSDNYHEVFNGFGPYTNLVSRKDAIPATLPQRELLFSKMREAGLEWDAEKLEPNILCQPEVIKTNDQEHSPWKPTVSQMSQLKWIAHQNADNMIGKELMTLYQDLQKLIE